MTRDNYTLVIDQMPKLLIHFARYGPYHHARLLAAAEVLEPLGWEVIGLETAGKDVTYEWDEVNGSEDGPRVITVFPGRVHEEITGADCKRVLHPLLEKAAPDVIAIAGWAGTDARACLTWCRKHGKRSIVMSETREADGVRVWWKEWIKGWIIRRFNGALVGGASQRNYLVKLGLRDENIQLGYNVVNNSYFVAESAKHRSADALLRQPYFLASNRFIERKNLGRLIDAYALYLRSASNTEFRNAENPSNVVWNLCLLGDGELKAELVAHSERLGLNVVESAPWESWEPSQQTDLGQPTTLLSPTVFFSGFRQIEELPRFYAHAGCFVHPAIEEPWGLVINEAMACGLPVLSGRNVGAAQELIDDAVNGWNMDAGKIEEISYFMAKIAGLNEEQRQCLGTASVQILERRCPTIAFGKGIADLLSLGC